MNAKPIFLKIACAVLVGCIVTGITLYVAWNGAQSADLASYEQYITKLRLQDLSGAISKYSKNSKVPPKTIEELLTFKSTHPADFPAAFTSRDSDETNDGWQRPLILTNIEGKTIVLSYGMDEKPGGEGLDCDLSTENWHPEQAKMTFSQFWSNHRTSQMKLSSFVCGALAGLIVVITVKPNERKSMAFLAIRLLFTTLGALIIASYITVLHVPSGH